MRTEDRRLRVRVTRQDAPDLGKLIEWVLNIAQARHRAWLNGEPDPYGLPVPERIEPLTLGGADGAGKFPGPSASPQRRAVQPP